jgi:hypothetical protein
MHSFFLSRWGSPPFFLLELAWNYNPYNPASCITGMTGVCHHTQLLVDMESCEFSA